MFKYGKVTMSAKRYNPSQSEVQIQQAWQEQGLYHFRSEDEGPVYSIDTPPPTVSGNLHLGHIYSYSQTDFIARFWRMRGKNVFYPMGFDDNGLPTERLTEKRLKVSAVEVGRQQFIQLCLQVSAEAEQEYLSLWQRLGLSVDWRHTYRTIDDRSRRISQLSFIELYRKGLVYHQEAPAIWCPECQTSIAQAELNDLERQSEFVTLDFRLSDGNSLPIATTRPELLPACVGIFVHPQDSRYAGLVGRSVSVPLFNQSVPVLTDSSADPQKGTGAVMCCTFGDQADVAWWRTYKLPLIQAVDRDGKMGEIAGKFAGLSMEQARIEIKSELERQGLVLDRQPTSQSIRVHERCDTPVEYIQTGQWFIRVLDFKEQLLQAGEQVEWRPAHMGARYRTWVENLNWDWCISRQRYFGVSFPLWFCLDCGAVHLADESRLPIDPADEVPQHPCTACGGTHFRPETDVLDTWATSSMSPQIAGRWLQEGSSLYQKVFPFTLRPQAHEIIRTWAFYTIVKSIHHFNQLPWQNVAISGWGIAGEGMGKISKSRGGGPMAPMEMIERYSADAVRYWAASTGPGKDAVISEEKVQSGVTLVTKLWNVANFCERFLSEYVPVEDFTRLLFSPGDSWILSKLHRLIERATARFEQYDYAAAKSEVEQFFWRDLADNYIEMIKQRLYGEYSEPRQATIWVLYQVLLAVSKLFAPFLPFVTEEIYSKIFASRGEHVSIHRSAWPEPDLSLMNEHAEGLGEILVELATQVRRYKSQQGLSLGSDLENLSICARDEQTCTSLKAALIDLKSITRARQIEFCVAPDQDFEPGSTAYARFDAGS
jgi:valyl-tRNA synthetase